LVIQYSIALGIFYLWNPYEISDKYPSYTMMFLQMNMLVNFIIYYYYTKTDSKIDMKKLTSFGIILIGCITVFVIFYYMWKIILNIQSFQTIFTFLIDFSILFGFLGIMGFFIIKYIGDKTPVEDEKDKGKLNIRDKKPADKNEDIWIIVPKTIIKMADGIKGQYSTVTNIVWILFSIEIALILVRLLLPNIIHYISSHDKSQLVGKPIYLNKEEILGKYENTNITTDKKKFSYKYSVSFWFYINPQPPNTGTSYNKYTNILNYGNKPSVQFHSKNNKLRVQCLQKNDDTMTTIYETDALQYQKWNNMVINYDSGNMDVFINGDLVGSRQNIAPFMKDERIYSGEKKGIEGGICNVNVYDHVLSLSSVSNTYHLLKNNDIPYIY